MAATPSRQQNLLESGRVREHQAHQKSRSRRTQGNLVEIRIMKRTQAQAPSQLDSLQAGDHRISSGANSLAQKTSGVSHETAKLPTSWTTTFGLTRQKVLCALPTAFLNKHPRAAVQIFKNHKLNGEKCYEGK